MNVNSTERTDAMGNEGVKSQQAVENVKKLAVEMALAGMTTKELSQRTGISIRSLYEYLHGKHMPTVKGYNALAGVFGWEKEKRPERKKKKTYEAVKISCEDAPPLPKPVVFTFEEEHVYRIYESAKKWDNDICLFMYEGKQGIHHCFREVRGGWTRTYTDAQLVGKHIKEEK